MSLSIYVKSTLSEQYLPYPIMRCVGSKSIIVLDEVNSLSL